MLVKLVENSRLVLNELTMTHAIGISQKTAMNDSAAVQHTRSSRAFFETL